MVARALSRGAPAEVVATVTDLPVSYVRELGDRRARSSALRCRMTTIMAVSR